MDAKIADTNIFIKIFRGDANLKKQIESLNVAVSSIVQNVEVYERNTKHKITSEKNSAESFSTIKAKYWFDKSGLLLKTETETEVVAPITKSFSRRTSIYEYDPNIKIEAPIK